jgi:hypothetical protein
MLNKQLSDLFPHNVLQWEYFYIFLAVTIYCLAYQFASILYVAIVSFNTMAWNTSREIHFQQWMLTVISLGLQWLQVAGLGCHHFFTLILNHFIFLCLFLALVIAFPYTTFWYYWPPSHTLLFDVRAHLPIHCFVTSSWLVIQTLSLFSEAKSTANSSTDPKTFKITGFKNCGLLVFHT